MRIITDLFFEYGLLAMFILILIEYACFPISSEIVLPFSGAFASIKGFSFWLVLPISVLAGIIGTSLCYGIGRIGGHILINKIKTIFPKSEKGMNSAQDTFHKYGAMAVCIGRVIPICRTYIAFFAGATQLNFMTYVIASTIGILTWNFLLIGLGYVFHGNYQMIASHYSRYKNIIIPMILFLILYYFIKYIRKKTKGT